MPERDEKGRFTRDLNDWSMFKKKCANPDCDNEVFVTGPNRSEFCSRKCEANYHYKHERFAGTEPELWPDDDYMERA